MPELVTCNLCGADDARLLYAGRDYRLHVDDRAWNLVRCRVCGLGYLNPRPTMEEMSAYYPVSYFAHRGDMARRYGRQAAYVPGTSGDLLDVGAARGDFLAVMSGRGWTVTGIEPWASENPHGLRIHRQRFPVECDIDGESFDVVTAWAVFEHLHDPAQAFERVASLLRPGGRFVLQVPSLRSVNARFAHLEDIPRHLYFFTPATVERYAAKNNLTVLETIHTTDLFAGSSGRGVLRRLLVHAVGGDDKDFFDFYRRRREDRFRTRPVLAIAWTATALIERLVITDWLTRLLRVSGQIVVVMEKRPPAVDAHGDGKAADSG